MENNCLEMFCYCPIWVIEHKTTISIHTGTFLSNPTLYMGVQFL